MHPENIFTQAARGALAALFSTRCLSCDCLIETVRQDGLCLNCIDELHPAPPNLCAQCAMPLDFTYEIDTQTDYFCGECRQNPPPYDSAIFSLIYEGPARDLIHAFKYKSSPYLVGACSQMGIDRLLPWLSMKPGAVIVPVPLHWRRLYWRGFNHAYLLAARIGESAGLEVDEGLLVRTRNTTQQYGLNKKQRGKNVKGAFVAPFPERVAGKDIVIFDDIITTGATVAECGRALWKAGPKSVSVAALCKAGG